MKKYVFLIILIALGILVDGALSYDIFDLRLGSPAGWIGILLTLTIFITIFWAESTKKDEKKNTPR